MEGEQKIRLQGDPYLADAEISKVGLKKLVSKGEIVFFCQLRCDEDDTKEHKDWPELMEVLKEYKNVLAEPHTLPPDRETNHRISRIPRSQPINVHPYCYPHYQKNEIERLTWEMLN